jgi:hypothetical protein
MQHTLIYPPLSSPELGTNFNVVIAYEDFGTGKHAKTTCDLLTENLGPDCHVNTQMWKFDVLALPKLREMAAKDAAAADIIIISCRGDSDLSAPLKAWIESWLTDKRSALALVALFDRPEDHVFQSRAVRDYLAGVAKRGNLAFFAQPEEASAQFQGGDIRRENRTESALAGAVYRDHSLPRWGINE